MKKSIVAVLAFAFSAVAFGQSYPSPTFNNVAINGTATIPHAAITGGTITGLGSPLPVASGGTNSASPSGTALDNITGFSSTGFMNRTGAGAYSFTASTGSGSVVLGTSPTIASPTVTGAFTATGLVTTADLASQAANTVLANATGSSASPTAITVTGCNGAAQALQWTNAVGFGCNSNIATSGSNANITSLSGLTTPLSVGQGGTGATSSTGTGSVVLSASPAFTGTPTAPTAAQGANTTQVATTAFAQTAASNPLNPVTVGSSVLALTTPGQISTAATTTNGSPTITVTSAVGLVTGMGIYAAFLPASCQTPGAAFVAPYITNIVGTTVTMSCNATTTNGTPVAVNFGQPRWDANSVATVNDLGVQTLKVGRSAGNGVGGITGNTASWLDQVSAGQDYRLTSAAQILIPPGGGYGLTVGARSSDATGGASAFPFQSILYLDTWGNTTYSSENVYLQDNLAAATAGHAQPHIQMEQSVNSLWGSPPAEDPYTINVTNQTISHRYDCGTGQSSTAGMNGCTTAIDMVTNPENFQNGIVFGNGAIAVNAGFGNGIVFPQSVGLIWYSAASTYAAQIVSNSAAQLNFQFPATSGAGIKMNGVLTQSTTAPTILSGFGTGPTITTANGTNAFVVHVGTSPGATGVLSMPAASNGWMCDGVDASQNNATQFFMRETANTTTSVTFTMFSSSGSASSFVAGDSLIIKCTGY